MAFQELEKHLIALGIKPLDDEWAPIAPAIRKAIEDETGGAFPEVVRWLFARFGGFSFEEGAYYPDPQAETDAMIGWFFGEEELRETYEATRDSMPEDVVPIANDGGDNYIAVGIGKKNRGLVSFYLHDAPDDRRLYPLADSVEAFLRSLHREDDEA